MTAASTIQFKTGTGQPATAVEGRPLFRTDSGYLGVGDGAQNWWFAPLASGLGALAAGRLVYADASPGGGRLTGSAQLTTDGSTLTMGGFKLTTGAHDSYVLTSDANGVGTWQALPPPALAPDTGLLLVTADVFADYVETPGMGITYTAGTSVLTIPGGQYAVVKGRRLAPGSGAFDVSTVSGYQNATGSLYLKSDGTWAATLDYPGAPQDGGGLNPPPNSLFIVRWNTDSNGHVLGLYAGSAATRPLYFASNGVYDTAGRTNGMAVNYDASGSSAFMAYNRASLATTDLSGGGNPRNILTASDSGVLIARNTYQCNWGLASAWLQVVGTSEQLRLGYDAAHYLSVTVDATGAATLSLTAPAPGTPALTLANDVQLGTSTAQRSNFVGGSGAAPPANPNTPAAWLEIKVNGTPYKVPLYQ